jgi:hypothetical protein
MRNIIANIPKFLSFKHMFNKFTKLFILIMLNCWSWNLSAQELEAEFVDWSVFTTRQGNKKICYIASLPVKKDGNYNKRGEPYFMVTNNNEGLDEISVSSGYVYKKNSEVEISFGIRKFSIFTHGHLAWANEGSDDIEIVKAMRLSRDFVISGTSNENTFSQDTYSLIGFLEAYKKMKDLCLKDSGAFSKQ